MSKYAKGEVFYLLLVISLLFSLYTNIRLYHVFKDLTIYINNGCNGRYQGEQP